MQGGGGRPGAIGRGGRRVFAQKHPGAEKDKVAGAGDAQDPVEHLRCREQHAQADRRRKTPYQQAATDAETGEDGPTRSLDCGGPQDQRGVETRYNREQGRPRE